MAAMVLSADIPESARFQALIENAADGIALMNFASGTAQMTYVSPSAERILGYPSEEILGHDPGEWTHPEDLQMVGSKILELAERPGDSMQMQYRLRHKQGSYRWIESHVGNFLHDANLNALVFNFRDITERKETEALLESARLTAIKANAAKSQFLASMSHELRTPLNAIVGFSEILASENLNAEQQKLSEYVLRSAKQLLSLIEEVLDFARFEAGKVSFEITRVSVKPLLTAVCEQMSAMAAARQIRMELRCTDDLYVMTDALRLRQIVVNLVSNAIKYNRTAGAVRITCRTVNHQVVISVTDTGRGIKKELTARIFQPFDRLGQERTAIEGTGLGLSVVKFLADGMNSPLGFRTHPPKGSVFWIRLQMAAAEIEQSASAATTIESSDLTQYANLTGSVLYIEDNEINAELMAATFKKYMPRVKMAFAPDATSGIASAQDLMPDLILMDVHLPDMSGLDATAALRKNQATANTPIFGVSADASEEAREKAHSVGMTAYFTKPFSIRELLDESAHRLLQI